MGNFYFSFNRCLPLPSQEWSDISNDIFCHNHNCDGSQFNFIPKQNDLLFSEQEILLHRESLKMSNVIMNSSNVSNNIYILYIYICAGLCSFR